MQVCEPKEAHASESKVSKKMTLADALSVIENSNAKIKEAASVRYPEGTDPFASVYGSSENKAAMMLFASLPLFMILFPMDFGFLAVLPMASVTMVRYAKKTPDSLVHSILSHKKMKKARGEVLLNKQFFEMGEEKFAEQEAKILRKARKALKLLNAHFEGTGKKVVYSSVIGEEGFTILTDAPEPTQWDIARLEISNHNMLELTSGAAADHHVKEKSL